MTLSYQFYSSPLGRLSLVASERYLCGVFYEQHKHQTFDINSIPCKPNEVLELTCHQLQQYFSGQRKVFELPLQTEVGTEFQRQVWQALLQIPYGETRSYGALAQSIGRPKAVRALGAANGRNPLSIIVPCHRVIASSGHLHGYAGGLARKQELLDLERKISKMV